MRKAFQDQLLQCNSSLTGKEWQYYLDLPNNNRLAIVQRELQCFSQPKRRRGGERDSRPFPSVGMLASRIGPPTFLGWQRFFSSLSEAREALAHVSEGEKKTKGLDRNRVSLILVPTPSHCDTGRNSEAELRHRQPGGCRGGPPSVVRHALPHRASDPPPWLVHRAQEHPRPRQGCRGTARQQPHSVSKRVHPVLNLMFFSCGFISKKREFL